MRSTACVSIALLLAAALAGCGVKQVRVGESPVPPLQVRPLPVAAALEVDEALAKMQHSATLPDGSEWAMDLGAAQVGMFRTTFGSLFRELTLLRPGEAAPRAVRIRLRPELRDFQFSTPGQSGRPYYESWMAYRLEIRDAGGRLQGDWSFTAYGRSPEQTLDATGSMSEAVRMALRDAAAVMALRFKEQPAVQQLLEITEGKGDAEAD